MSFDGDHLLKRLQPVIGTGRVASTDGRSGAVGEGEFARIIRLANDGTLDSGRVVDVDRRFVLDAEQLAGIGRACDSLESAGLDDGIVLLGGRAFLVEVSERKIMDELGSDQTGRVQTVGGVVLVEPMSVSIPEDSDEDDVQAAGGQADSARPRLDRPFMGLGSPL
ncbi:MAG: hypothetical protein CMJ53_01140 [Planctomycetaceae bacterium]|nr:hypothetical protein [Planctomycetaceae bacterium]